ncbi:MAG: TRAP transporter substrate-binding protein DctP [Myxococcales bacterium]|nr:TRAP transporter substrate-binding protein DctP [Myxococcales bacterium]
MQRWLTFALCLMLAPAWPAGARTLKIATMSPDGTTWMKEMREGAKEIEERTEGRVKLKFYPGGVMGNDQTVLRKMRVGQLHGGAFPGGGLVEVYNDIQVYSLPFLFHSYAEVDYVRARMDSLIQAGLEQRGLVAMGLSEGGFAHLLSSEPLKSRADLDGKRVWIPQGDTMSQIAFETAGISPVPLPISDVYTGLQTGLINTVASSPIGAIAFQWHTKVRFLTDVPLIYLIGTLAFAKRSFDKLGTEGQAVLREVMGRIFRRLDRASRRDNAAARDALANQGIEFVSPTSEELSQWRSIAEEAEQRYQGRNLYSEEMYEILKGHLRDFRNAPPGDVAR